MKAIVKPRLTNAQFKALKDEIREQCVSETRKYEVLIDAVIFNAFAKKIGYDRELLKEVYDEVACQRARAKAEYQREGLQTDFASFFELQAHGIDLMRWSEGMADIFKSTVE